MALIDRFVPVYSMRQVDCVAVAAPPAEAWHAVRSVDLAASPVARALFGLRTLPERLRARLRGAPLEPPAGSTIDAITARGDGFLLLGEDEGREIVVGAVGKFWQTSIPFSRVTPDAFVGFSKPGFGVLAWALSVEPRSDGGSTIAFDLRVRTTDRASWRSFERYWLVIGPFSHALRRAALRRFEKVLGPVEPSPKTNGARAREVTAGGTAVSAP